jgi:drug/metabolite transporter (DMT)-like permease
LTATALRFSFAPFFAFIFIISGNQLGALTTITSTQWSNLLLITFTTGMVALGFYYYGLKKTPAKITTICELVWPASAIMIDFFLYHKVLSLTQILGVILLLLAIYKVTKPLKTKQQV